MRADDDVHLPLFQLLDRLFLLRAASEPAEQINVDRKIFHPLHKVVVMLLGEDRRRHQKCHLLAVLHRLKRRTDRNFRLSVSDVAADQTIHNLRALHVGLGRRNGKILVFRLLKREHLLELFLPHSVRSERKSLFILAHCVKLHEVFGDLLDRSPDSRLGLVPLLSAKLV